MGQLVARLTLASSLLGAAGCSVIYNPSNLPDPTGDGGVVDAVPDAEIILDADPTALELERVSPTVIFEGTGTGGGRRGVLTVHGKQIIPGATVSITPHGPGTPMITVHNEDAAVAANGQLIAVPITIEVNPGLATGTKLRLDVTVTQQAGASSISKTLAELAVPAPNTPVLELQGLAELEGVTAALPPGVHEFSRVNLSGNLTATAGLGPLIIRATGSITIDGTAEVNAAGDQPGAGGGAGGAGGDAVFGTGGTGAGPGGGKPSGGGAGFALAGGGGGLGGAPSGNPQLTTLDAPNRSSGGGGGNGGATNAGGAGGGGGGTIELTAGGTITLGNIEANGGNGAAASGASPGGGGSGGVILVRSNVSLAITGAASGSGGTGANTGSVGRIRLDVPSATPLTTPPAFRGPMFAPDTFVITRTPTPAITVFGEKNSAFRYYVRNENNTMAFGPLDQTIADGSNTFTLQQGLFRGINTLCVEVGGASFQAELPEARNCIKVAYVAE